MTLQALARSLTAGARRGMPEGAGAVAAAIERPGAEPTRVFAGRTITHDADGRPLDDPRSKPVDAGTFFDLASVTKVLTALAAARLLDAGTLALETRAVDVLGAGSVPDPRITVRHLLTHTSGLPPHAPLWRIPGSREARLSAIGALEPISEPGTVHAYSCLGFLVLGRILERRSGLPLPDLVRREVLDPAAAEGVTWSIVDPRCAAATEIQVDPPRGLVQGVVHDETAWAIGGAANAGAFATLDGALAIGRILAGTATGPRLSPAVRRGLATDQLGAGAGTGRAWRQGLGLRIGAELPDGTVVPDVIGHPGFTGTAIWAQPSTGTVAVLLTNRVHPDRSHFAVDGARRELARLAFGG